MASLLLPLLKFIHLWSVILFVGNAALGPYRRRQARRTGNPQVIAGTYEIHTRSGPAVTIPWFFAAVASGVGLAWASGMPILGTGWIVAALVLTLAVAVLFVARIGPLQREATAEAARLVVEPTAEQEARFARAAARVEPWSHFAHALFAAIIALMVFKPAMPVPW